VRFFQPRWRPRRAEVPLGASLGAEAHSDVPGAVAGRQDWRGETAQTEEAG